MAGRRSAVVANLAHLRTARKSLAAVIAVPDAPVVGIGNPSNMGEVIFMRQQLERLVDEHEEWLGRRAKS